MHIVRRFSPAVAHSLAGFVLLNCIVRGCEEEKTNLVVPFSLSSCVTRRRRCTRDLCAVCRFHGRPFFPFVPYWDRPLRSWWVLRLRETVPRCPTRMSCFGIAPPGAPFFHSFFLLLSTIVGHTRNNRSLVGAFDASNSARCFRDPVLR